MIYLDDKDIVRHRLVKKVIDAYKQIENHDWEKSLAISG
jgi:phosphate starvation-inducible PhoH-like protein